MNKTKQSLDGIQTELIDLADSVHGHISILEGFYNGCIRNPGPDIEGDTQDEKITRLESGYKAIIETYTFIWYEINAISDRLEKVTKSIPADHEG